MTTTAGAPIAHPNRSGLPATNELRQSLAEVADEPKETASHAFPAAREQIDRAADDVAHRAASLEQWLQSTIAKKPIASLLWAAGIGMFAGMWLLRRR